MELSGKTLYGPVLKTTQLSVCAQNHASPEHCRKSFTIIFVGVHDFPLTGSNFGNLTAFRAICSSSTSSIFTGQNRATWSSWHSTNSVKALKALKSHTDVIMLENVCDWLGHCLLNLWLHVVWRWEVQTSQARLTCSCCWIHCIGHFRSS